MNLRQLLLQNPPARTKIALWLASLIAVGLLGFLHLHIGMTYEFHLFFALPIVIIGWFVSTQRAYVLAIMTVVLWYLADRQVGGNTIERSALIFNTAVRTGLFVGLVWLVGELRRKHSGQ